ncbi:unnamed protein product [Effrenium voratum]|nr:unnamed protein product [Effrenium voratum]
MVARVLATACRDLEELLSRPAGRAGTSEDADDTLPAAFRDLAQKDSAWEGLDEAEIAMSAPLLLGPHGLLELAESGGQDKNPVCALGRRYALQACARFLDLHGSGRAALALLGRRAGRVADACLNIFRNDVDNKAGLNALYCMLNALEVPNVPLPADALGDELLRELKLRHSRLTAGQSSALHKVLAVLADARAARGAVQGQGAFGLVPELRTRLLGTLEREANSSKPTLELVAGLLEACAVMLRRHADQFNEEELCRLYNVASSIALVEVGASRLGPRRAALRLFQDHAFVFRRFFATEAQKSLKEMEAKAAGEVRIPDSSLLGKMLASTAAPQADVAAAGRGMLDAVLRALSDGVLSDLGETAQKAPATRKRPLEDDLEVQDLPPEAAVVRGWYPHFLEMVQSSNSTRLTGARCLGALVPAVARLEGAAVVLEFLEVILDAAEAAALPAGLEEEEAEEDAETAAGSTSTAPPSGSPPTRLTPSALPELAEALARAIPAVSRWLTGTQWLRLLSVGVQLLRGFGRAFTKKRPLVARAVSKLLGVFRGCSHEREDSCGLRSPASRCKCTTRA